METQFRIVTKEEAHRFIDAAPGNTVILLTYNVMRGISDHGRHIRKKKGRMLANKASTIILCENDPVITLNLHDSYITEIPFADRENIIKSIILSKIYDKPNTCFSCIDKNIRSW